MFSFRRFSALAAVFLLSLFAVFSAAAAEPVSPGSVMKAFSALVDKAAEDAGYLDPEQVARIRTQAEKIFPLHPEIPSREAARLDREGEQAFISGEIRKKFSRSAAEVREELEKKAATLFPLFEKGVKVEITYRRGKYHAKGVYYGRAGDYLRIGGTSVPVRDLSEDDLRKFDSEKNKAVKTAYIQAECGEYEAKRQAAMRNLKEQWDNGREERRFKLGYLRFARKWRSGGQVLDELVRRKNRDLLQAVREKAEKLAARNNFSGAEKILRRFVSAHPDSSAELEPDLKRLHHAASLERSRAALAAAGTISDPGEALAFLEKFLADDPDSPGAPKIRAAMAELESKVREQEKCREAISSARKLKTEDSCAFLEQFMSEYTDYCGIKEVKAFYQAERKKLDRKRCERVLEDARKTDSDEQAVKLLEHFLEDQPDCDGIEAVREACRERKARLEKKENGN